MSFDFIVVQMQVELIKVMLVVMMMMMVSMKCLFASKISIDVVMTTAFMA